MERNIFFKEEDDLLYDIEFLRENVVTTKKRRPPKQDKHHKYKRVSFSNIFLTIDLSSADDLLDKTIKSLYVKCYEMCKGNQTDMARVLGSSVRHVRKKLKEYNIYPKV